MTFTTEHQPGVCAEPPAATRGFALNHTMMRVKDPALALGFYTEVMGLRLLRKLDFPEMGFSLYFLAHLPDVLTSGNAVPADAGERTGGLVRALARSSTSAPLGSRDAAALKRLRAASEPLPDRSRSGRAQVIARQAPW